MKYRKKPGVVEAYTFADLEAGNLTAVRENENMFRVGTGLLQAKVHRSSVLVVGEGGVPYTVDAELFKTLYEPA